MRALTLYALRGVQGVPGVTGRTEEVFLALVRAADLLEFSRIDRRTPENPGGYQRDVPEVRLDKARRGSTTRYLLSEEGTFPSSIVVNIRPEDWGKVKVEETGIPGVVKLVIPEGVTLWVIDGQVRREALDRVIREREEFRDYLLPVTILHTDRFWEVVYFYIINKRQKSVPTEYAYRILWDMYREKGKEWLFDREGWRGVLHAVAMELTERLARDEDSPWYGDIALLEAKRPRYMITATFFADSLTHILHDRTFMAMPTETLLGHIKTYWRAIRTAFASYWRAEEYYLRRVTGVYAMHMAFPEVYGRVAGAGKPFSEDVLVPVFAKLCKKLEAEYGTSIWHPTGPTIFRATSMKAIRELAENYIIPRLKEALGELGY